MISLEEEALSLIPHLIMPVIIVIIGKAILPKLSIPIRPLDPLVLLMRFLIINSSRGVLLKIRSIRLLGL